LKVAMLRIWWGICADDVCLCLWLDRSMSPDGDGMVSRPAEMTRRAQMLQEDDVCV
jgi:hypothetical protein